MEATLVLCDYAEAVNGKLYISGAGWSDIAANIPAPVALGVMLNVPWDQANIPHRLAVDLMDQDGKNVLLGDPPAPLAQGGAFEVGRPPGVPRGIFLPVVFAIRWPLLPIPPGSYAFTLTVDDQEVARVSFRANISEVQHG